MLTPEKIAELKSKYGPELFKKTAAEEVVVMRRPNRGDYERYKAAVAADSSKRFHATEQLLCASIVHPAPSELTAMFERKPGLIETLGGEALELAGFVLQVETEKL